MRINIDAKKEIAHKAKELSHAIHDNETYVTDHIIKLMEWAYKEGLKHGKILYKY